MRNSNDLTTAPEEPDTTATEPEDLALHREDLEIADEPAGVDSPARTDEPTDVDRPRGTDEPARTDDLTGTDPQAGTGTHAGVDAPGQPAAETAPEFNSPTAAQPRPGAGQSAGAHAKQEAGLFEDGDIDKYQDDWRSLQASFVDDPAASVRDADELVGRIADTITNRIAEQRKTLSRQHDGDGEHTEELRQALRQYRTLFEQLLPSSH
jgi:hypothetical protein